MAMKKSSVLNGKVLIFVNTKTGMTLTAWEKPDGSVAAEMSAKEGLINQQWKVEADGEETFRLVNEAYGKALDVMFMGQDNGTPVHLWDKSEGATQLWKMNAQRGGRCQLIHAESGRVLDVIAMSEEEGAGLQIWDATEGETQIWKAVEKKPEGAKKPARNPCAKKAAAAKEPVAKEEAGKATPATKAASKTATKKCASRKTKK